MRVEVVKPGHTRWYRIVRGDDERGFSIAAVERILSEAGIDMADLLEVTAQPFEHVDEPASGVA